MRIIRFILEGYVNSMRYAHSFKNHRTYLIPPKTMVVGLLANICNKSVASMPQLWNISVGVVPQKISSIFEDTWVYKLLECKKGDGSGRGSNTGVVFRERLFKPVYSTYLKINEDELANEVVGALREPQRTTYLGQSDELVVIRNVEDITRRAELTQLSKVNSSFHGLKLRGYHINGSGFIVPPRRIATPTSFDFQDTKRSPKDAVEMIDFYGVTITVENSFEGILFNDEHVFLY